MARLEASVERALCRAVVACGWLCLKFTSPGYTGVPDRVLLGWPGRIIFVETKTETGRLSPRQKLVKGLLTKLGFKVFVVVGRDDIAKVIEEIKQCD